MDFYQQVVKPVFDINDKVIDCANLRVFVILVSQVCLVHDPRVSHAYGRLYTVEYLGNIVGGRKTLYNNQPLRVLKQALYDSIAADEVRTDFFRQFSLQSSFFKSPYGLVLISANICTQNMAFWI